MFKNLKLAVKTSLIMIFVLTVCFVVLWRVVDQTTTVVISGNITNQMTDAVKSRAAIIDDYVKNVEDYLVAYGQSNDVKNLLRNPDSEELLQAAQKYTEDVANTKGIFEGLYASNYDTQVLVDSDPKVVGITTRKDPEDRKKFQETVLAKKEITNLGIIPSPGSGAMVISMYYPVYDGNECIGLVGAGVYAQDLMNSLLSLNVEGLSDTEYVFLDVATGNYLYNDNPELICTQTTDPGMLQILDKIRQDESITLGVESYVDSNGKEQMTIYSYLPNRGWVFALKGSKDDLYNSLKNIRRSMGVLCLIAGVVIIVLIILILLGIGKQLDRIRRAITTLGEMDLTAAESLKKYSGQKDEIGVICDAITKTCENLNLYIGAVDAQLSNMAKGDYTQEMNVHFIGVFTNLEKSMKYIQGALRESFREINTVTSELVIGSNQVSDSATQLANAAVNANQLILAIDNNVNEISGQVSDSAQSASAAKQEMEETIDLVNSSQQKMKELAASLEKIEKSASAIQEVSNNMEQIAKQTNILALNALVEASRAGDLGKGFSVVANEIRQLAQESNESAANAYKLIHETLECVGEGTKIGEETLQYLDKVVNQTAVIDASITSIAAAAKLQDENIMEVRNNLHTMSSTIESTAGMAQQSAAASNELDGQTNVLKDSISKYKI